MVNLFVLQARGHEAEIGLGEVDFVQQGSRRGGPHLLPSGAENLLCSSFQLTNSLSKVFGLLGDELAFEMVRGDGDALVIEWSSCGWVQLNGVSQRTQQQKSGSWSGARP